MLQVTIPASPEIELWDYQNQEFIIKKATKEQKLQLEHSLVSLSKWESKWCKPFLSDEKMTEEESIDYIRCMTITQNVPPEVYDNIPNNVIEEVSAYIAKPMTATWFSDDGKKKRKNNGKQITSELIYHWMIALNIPVKFEKWHLNRLLTQIRVCDAENNPPKNKSKKSIMSEYAALNKARRQRLNSKG
jgi:hypothetical protein